MQKLTMREERTQASVTGLQPGQNLTDYSEEAQRWLTAWGFSNMLDICEDGANVITCLIQEQRQADLIDDTLKALDVVPPSYLTMTPYCGSLQDLTALHLAAHGKDKADRRHEVIRALVQKGANLEQRDGADRTPLQVAFATAYKKGAEALVSLGANLHVTRDGGRNCADGLEGQQGVELLVGEKNRQEPYWHCCAASAKQRCEGQSQRSSFCASDSSEGSSSRGQESKWQACGRHAASRKQRPR